MMTMMAKVVKPDDSRDENGVPKLNDAFGCQRCRSI